MNSIKDLLPGSMRERTFQLKARRDAGAVWNDPQFVECKKCGRRATRQIWNKAQYVCPNCGVHLPIGGYYRLSLVLDKGSFRELDADLAPQDVLQFPGYPEKLEAQTGKTGLKEAVITATGRIEGTPVVTVVLDSRFFMGSMSTTVGEKITRAVEHATAKHLPLIIFSASGGVLYDVMQGNRPEKTPDYFDGDTYIQHNTGIADGLSGLGAALEALGKQGIQMIYTTVHQVLAQGNYVLAVSEGTFGGAPTSYYDLWRIENGKIAEHWDVMETIADKSTWQNQNGKF